MIPRSVYETLTAW